MCDGVTEECVCVCEEGPPGEEMHEEGVYSDYSEINTFSRSVKHTLYDHIME